MKPKEGARLVDQFGKYLKSNKMNKYFNELNQ